jgi:ribosomal protein S18 acetylase RimI-like enzyme
MVAVENGVALGWITVRFKPDRAVGEILMLEAVPGAESVVLAPLVDYAVVRVWAEPAIQYLTATLHLDSPEIRAAFAKYGIQCVPREEMRLADVAAASASLAPTLLPSGFRFAPLALDDVNAAAKVIVDAYRGTIDEQIYPEMRSEAGMRVALTENLTDRHDVYDASASTLLYQRDQPIGLIVCALTGERRGYVIEVCVLPQFRRRGLGRALISHALSAFHAENANGAQLWVTSDNPARTLYESVGFRSQVPMWVYPATRP